MKTKFYKKVIKAFGGAAVYLDKPILSALNVTSGDEIVLEIRENSIIISKPNISTNEIQELLDELNCKLEKRA